MKEDTTLMIMGIMGILLMGFILGYLFCYERNIKTTDEQAEYVEMRMKNIEGLLGAAHIQEGTTIHSWVQLYFNNQYPQGRWLLKHELGNICGISKCDYEIDLINMTEIEDLIVEICK